MNPNSKDSSLRLSYDGQARKTALTAELRILAHAVPAQAISTDIPVALRLDPARKRALLDDLLEEPLTQRVLMPLLEKMGFFHVSYNNGPNERGKDVFACKFDEIREPSWLAVVAKADNLSGSTGGGNNAVPTIVHQIELAYGSPVNAPPTGKAVYVERVWVMTSGRIPENALHNIEQRLPERLRHRVRWINGRILVGLIDRYRSETWQELLHDSEPIGS